MVEFGCVGAEIKWDTVLVCGLVLHRKIRLTQLWVELSWVIAKKGRILQGLGVVPGSATERWSFKKRNKIIFFYTSGPIQLQLIQIRIIATTQLNSTQSWVVAKKKKKKSERC